MDDCLNFTKIHPRALSPNRTTLQAAGYDLYTCEEVIIPPWSIKLIKTGIIMKLPNDTYGRVTGRSGISLKNKLLVINGVIDSDYTGEIGVIVFNIDSNPQKINQGFKIAQIIIEQHKLPILNECSLHEWSSLFNNQNNVRKNQGFGSSGNFKT